MATKMVKTSSGREMTLVDWELEQRGVNLGWPVSDVIKADVVAYCHDAVNDPEVSDRERMNAAKILVNVNKQNIEIARDAKRMRELEGVTLVQNNLNLSETDSETLYTLLAPLLGGSTPTEGLHAPAPQLEDPE